MPHGPIPYLSTPHRMPHCPSPYLSTPHRIAYITLCYAGSVPHVEQLIRYRSTAQRSTVTAPHAQARVSG
eukprot:2528233-Rhodomonas_salina.2